MDLWKEICKDEGLVLIHFKMLDYIDQSYMVFIM